MSRTAIQARPVEERTRFLASSAITQTMPSTNRYFRTGELMSIPKKTTFCALMTPDELWFPHHKNLCRQRCHRKIKTLDAQGRQAEHHAHQRRAGAGQNEGQQNRDALDAQLE